MNGTDTETMTQPQGNSQPCSAKEIAAAARTEASALASQLQQSWRETADQASRSGQHMEQVCRDYMTTRPWGVLAVGFAAGFLLGRLARSRC